jgi:hypothetical protein
MFLFRTRRIRMESSCNVSCRDEDIYKEVIPIGTSNQLERNVALVAVGPQTD